MVRIGKKKVLDTGDKCPKCKIGRLALASATLNIFEWDDEPYKSGEVEKVNGDEFEVNTENAVLINIHACDNCYEIESRWFGDTIGENRK